MKKHVREANMILGRIDKDVLATMKKHGGFVAGGAVTSIFTSAPINDFDIFFPTVKAANNCVAGWDEKKSEKPVVTDNAYSFQLDHQRYQFIKVATGTPEQVIGGFDFTVCMGAVTVDGDFTFAPDFFQHLAQRRLVFNIGTEFPICALYRTRKYIKRGFELSGIEAIKLALRIQNLDISDYKELRRQLMGIDTLFLKELTDSLKTEGEKKYDLNEFLATLEKWLEKLDRVVGNDD